MVRRDRPSKPTLAYSNQTPDSPMSWVFDLYNELKSRQPDGEVSFYIRLFLHLFINDCVPLLESCLPTHARPQQDACSRLWNEHKQNLQSPHPPPRLRLLPVQVCQFQIPRRRAWRYVSRTRIISWASPLAKDWRAPVTPVTLTR